MRKSTSKIVSLMVAASMMFTTVMTNVSMVSAASYENPQLPYTIADGASSNAFLSLPVQYDESTNVDVTVEFTATALGGSGSIFVLESGGQDSLFGLRVDKDRGGVGIGLADIVSTEVLPIKVEPETNVMNLKYDRTTKVATLTMNGSSITATLNGLDKEGTGAEKVIDGLKLCKKTGRAMTVTNVTCAIGNDVVVSDSAAAPSEPETESTSQTSTETSTEAPVETTTSVDLGVYDPSNTSTPQAHAEVAGAYGTANVKTGDTVQVDFVLTGNSNNITNYEFFVVYDPSFLELVQVMDPDSYDGYLTFKNGKSLVVDPYSISMNSDYIKYAGVNSNPEATPWSGNGMLTSIQFKVIGTEGSGFVKMATGDYAGDNAPGFINVDANPQDLGVACSGIKLAIASDEPTEAPTEAPTQAPTEAPTEATTAVIEETESSTAAATEEEVETTTRRKSSGGGGGGSSSSNAAKENNENASNVGSISAQPVGGSDDDSTSTGSTTGSSTSTARVSSVGEYVAPSGITINPPALESADGEIVAGSKLNSSSLVSTNKFNDISTRAWAQTAINKLASIGVINGVGEGKFAPDATSKRGDFMVMLTKVLGVTGTPQSSFADVPANKYYANAVNLAKDLGLANGVGDNKFNPEAPITRQDMMVLTAKALEVVGYDVTSTDVSVLDKYADASKIADYAKPYVAFLIENGLVNGTSNTTVDPTANMTRAQMAVLMSNLYDLITDAVVEAQEEVAVEEEVVEEEVAEEATEEATEEAADAEATEEVAEDAEATEDAKATEEATDAEATEEVAEDAEATEAE